MNLHTKCDGDSSFDFGCWRTKTTFLLCEWKPKGLWFLLYESDSDSESYTSSLTQIDPRSSTTEMTFIEERRLHCSRWRTNRVCDCKQQTGTIDMRLKVTVSRALDCNVWAVRFWYNPNHLNPNSFNRPSVPCQSIFSTSIMLVASASRIVVNWVCATCGCQSIITLLKTFLVVSAFFWFYSFD